MWNLGQFFFEFFTCFLMISFLKISLARKFREIWITWISSSSFPSNFPFLAPLSLSLSFFSCSSLANFWAAFLASVSSFNLIFNSSISFRSFISWSFVDEFIVFDSIFSRSSSRFRRLFSSYVAWPEYNFMHIVPTKI